MRTPIKNKQPFSPRGFSMFLFILLIPFLFYSCQSKSKKVTKAVKTEKAINKNQKLTKLPFAISENIITTRGAMAYYCPKKMLESSDNIVSVTISKESLNATINKLTTRVANSSGIDAATVAKDIDGTPIKISKKMKVELIYADENFQTVYKPQNLEQLFVGNDLNWDWIIRPNKTGRLQLSIVVSAFDQVQEKWVSAQSPPKVIEITVQIDPRSYLSKLWSFLESNPEWLFVQVIFPVIAFFVGRRKRKKKEALSDSQP